MKRVGYSLLAGIVAAALVPAADGQEDVCGTPVLSRIEVVARTGHKVEVRTASLPYEGVLRFKTALMAPHGTSGYSVKVHEEVTGARGGAGPVEPTQRASAISEQNPTTPEGGAVAPGRYRDSTEVVISQARFLMPEQGAPTPEEVRVTWRKREQKVVRVVGGTGSSLDLGIAIDVSESVANERASFARAADEGALRLLRAEDRVFRVDFGINARCIGETVGGPGSLFTAMPAWPPQKTAIFNGLAFALQRFDGLRDRAALIAFTDGCETTEGADWRAVLKAARTRAIPIVLVLADGTPCQKRETFQTRWVSKDGLVAKTETARFVDVPLSASRWALRELAKASGGLVLSLKSPEQAASIWAEVEQALAHLWVAVFEPSDPSVDGRHVEVRSASDALLRPSEK